MRHGRRLTAAIAILAGALAVPRWAVVGAAEPRARRLESLQRELIRLQREMEGLESRERGLLGDLARIDAAIALLRAQLEEATLRLKDTEDQLAASATALAALESAQARRAPLLAARLRELYKRGPTEILARVLGSAEGAEGLDGVRYAGYLARRDAVQLSAWRSSSRRVAAQRGRLALERERLAAQRAEADRSQAALERGRAERASLLARIRGDREQHARAIGELDAAAKDLGRIVASVGDASAAVALDVRTFRGLLDWPADGRVTAGFGKMIHPKFRTEVPHPGLDIDAPDGAPFRAVFDGRVAYAAPLHGYGLTVVVDHGAGVVSVYAHAGVLLVEAGQEVSRGQELGRVGDSGSLRGPYLYFEVRDGGKPSDPAAWLRRR